MVFFTIVIVVKYALSTESCPLFDDAVASGTLIYSQEAFSNNSNPNWLRDEYLMAANATQKLMDQYVDGDKSQAGHIHPLCSSKTWISN